jgi:hypothetical protein
MIPREFEKGQNEEILSKNHNLIRKIEHYKHSRWRRFKFWLKAKRKKWRGQ